jgi:hypothetical protein
MKNIDSPWLCKILEDGVQIEREIGGFNVRMHFPQKSEMKREEILFIRKSLLSELIENNEFHILNEVFSSEK